MDHVAIMKKSWGLIPKILSGEKTIESRWYQTKRAPWDQIKKGDKVYFKNSGEPVTASARVSRVEQFEIHSVADAKNIVKKYGAAIGLVNTNVDSWVSLPRYCILIFLEHPQEIKMPFYINKKGYGMATAWMCVSDITAVSVR